MFTPEIETETTQIMTDAELADNPMSDEVTGYDDDYLVERYGVVPDEVELQAAVARKAELCDTVDMYDARQWRSVRVPREWDEALRKYVPRKGPKTPGWNVSPPSSDEVKDSFTHPLDNIALVMGSLSNNLVAIDVDSMEAWEAWQVVLPAKNLTTSMMRTRPSAPGRCHFYYQVDLPLKGVKYYHPGQANQKEGTHLEILGDGRAALVFPSIHPDTGKKIRWFLDGDAGLTPTKVEAKVLQEAARLAATAAVFGRKWKNIEGRHTATMLALAGMLVRWKVSEFDAVLFARALFAAGGDKLDKRIEAVKGTYAKAAKNQLYTGLETLDKLHGDVMAKTLCHIWGVDYKNEVKSSLAQAPTPASQPLTTWAPCNIAEMLSTRPSAPEWIFEGVFARGITGGLAAQGGTGKSMKSMELGVSAAIGRSLIPFFKPVKPFKVMAFFGEDPHEVTSRRFHAIKDWARISPSEMALLKQNFYLYTNVAEPLVMVTDGKITPTDRYKWLVAEVGRLKPDIIFLDPKSRWSSADENNNDYATQFVTWLDALIRPYNSSILITHHVGKGNAQGQYWSRGASALTDAARWFGSMKRVSDKEHPNPEDNENNYLAFHVTKSNYTPITTSPIILRQLAAQGGVIEQYNGPVSKMSAILDAMATTLREFGPINRSAIGDASKGGREFVDAVRSRFECTADERKKALELGLQNGLFMITKVSGSTGRAAEKISVAPAEEVVDDVSDAESNPVPFLDDLDYEASQATDNPADYFDDLAAEDVEPEEAMLTFE